MTNEVFNGQRFWTYFKYDLTQMWRNHVKAAIFIGLSGLILYVIGVSWHALFDHVWMAPGFPARVAVFGIACFALELYQTRTYGYLTERRKGSAWLMLPASTFEKWLSMILMTLVVIPVAFLGTYIAVDAILKLADPTYGELLIGAAQSALESLQNSLVEANNQYSTTWNLGFMIWPALAGFCTNFLYFLLCGISFKRHKILWAFIILFLLSSVSGVITTMLGMENSIDVDIDDFAQAESMIRHTISWVTAGGFALAACLAGGIFYRLKTLKH